MTGGYVALLLLPTLATAQVGHPPGKSPYRDIRPGHTLTPLVGLFRGGGGRFGIGPHDGTVFGARYDIRTSSALQLGVGVMRGELDRLIVDPFVRVADRASGPVPQTVTFAELSVQLNVTGGKTWHRLAPYAGAAGGMAFASSVPADTSRFNFGNKFYFAPNAGVRLFIAERLHLRTEIRVAFWRIKYPATFQQEPPLEPGSPPDDSNAVITDGRTNEWTTSSWLLVGLGYGFRL